jgi:hypothetical protein
MEGGRGKGKERERGRGRDISKLIRTYSFIYLAIEVCSSFGENTAGFQLYCKE